MTDTNSDFPNTPSSPSASPAGYITPGGSSSGETPRTSAEISALRNNFWELALRKVVEAVQGFFTFGLGSAFDQLQSWASSLWNAAWDAFNKIGQLISNVGGTVISDVSDVINGVFNGLANLTNNLLHDAASVIGAIPQHLVTGLTGAISAINNAIGAAMNFIQNVIDAIMSALRGIPIIGGLIPDLNKAVKANKVDQQNATITAIVSSNRNPSSRCRYPISDVTFDEVLNNQMLVFGKTDGASAGTAHTHTLGNTNSPTATTAGWSVNQNESRGSRITIQNTTVHDTFGTVIWKDSGTLNNVYLELFKENADGSLGNRIYSQEFSSSITTTTAFYEFTLPSRLVVQAGERFLARVRNSSSVATTVWVSGFQRVASAPDDGFKTTGATDTNKTSYTAAEAATARSNGLTLNWFMLAAKALPEVDRSFSDDFNRLSIGGEYVRVSSTASLIDIWEERLTYTGVSDGDQADLYIRACSRDVNRAEANLYINTASTARCGILLHCSRDLSQVVYLGVNSTSAKIYSGSFGSLTERASLSSGGTAKWGLYYDPAADKYVALKDGVLAGLEWTSVGGAVSHGADYRFGGHMISCASGEPAGAIDDWTLRDWYIAIPAVMSAGPMTATALMPDATVTAGGSMVTTPMTATASMPSASFTSGAVMAADAMAATASMPIADFRTGVFAPVAMHYDTPGTYTYTIPAEATRIDRVGLAGGRGGRNYLFGASTNGGESGAFAWDTLIAGVHFMAGDTITVTVGAGGTAGGGVGGNTTITVRSNTLTAIGGDAYVSGYNGQAVNSGNTNSNKDVLLNGQTYVGGIATVKAARDNPQPGAGGWGSDSYGVAGRPGGKGQAWLYLYNT